MEKQDEKSTFTNMIFICCTGWYSLSILDEWKMKTSNFVLSMVKGHCLHLMCHLDYSATLNSNGETAVAH